MEIVADLLFQLFFYGVCWAIGAVTLYVLSFGRLISTRMKVVGRLPNGKIAVQVEVVCFVGMVTIILTVASAAFVERMLR
jgi:hypothetical protein